MLGETLLKEKVESVATSPETDVFLEGLNDAQRDAVLHDQGPLLIVAGAGTGKTTVISRRVARLIARGMARADGVLALTFTDKAAGEMQERIENQLPLGTYDLWIHTFHAFCQRILEEHALDIGLPNDFTLLTQTDAYLLVRRNFDKFALSYYRPRGNPTKFIHALLTHFSRLKDEAVRPEQYLAFVDEQLRNDDTPLAQDDERSRLQELANAYKTYQQVLLDNNCLDFGDLLLYALELLEKRPSILEKFQKQFSHIVVDEFQDTNWAQYALVKLLAGARKNITVVGDDDQAIYKFRGASVANILQFSADYPEARRIVLTENYRSRQNILDLSYQFICQNNPNRLEVRLAESDIASGAEHVMSKKLKASAFSDEGIIRHLHYATLDDEVMGVIDTIDALREESRNKEGEPRPWSDFAILVRSNSGAIDYSLELARRNIPYQFLALKGLYSKPIILDCIAYLAMLAAPYDSTSVFRVLSSPAYHVADSDLAIMAHEAQRRTVPLIDVVRQHALLADLTKDSHAMLDRFITDVDAHLTLAKRAHVSEVMVRHIHDSGYIKAFTNDDASAREQLSYLKQFHDRLKRFEALHDEPTLARFMEDFLIERESGEDGSLAFDTDTGPDMVKIMTVHAAKGLEFPFVFIVGLVDKRFPTISRGGDSIPVPEELLKEKPQEGDLHLEEERRLFYVAMTRAKQGLYFTSAEDYGGKTKKKVSRFLTELGFTDTSAEAINKKKGLPEPHPTPTRGATTYVIPTTFSFTQLAAYAKCPLQYKFAHVLRVPVLGKHQMSFGKTMHGTLEKFMAELFRRQGKTSSSVFTAVSPDDVAMAQHVLPVSKDELIALYDATWIDDWYPDQSTKDTYRKEGLRMLEQFYEDASVNMPKPMFLEKDFRITVGGYWLKGKIDRIDASASGEEGKVQIIDYKTGTPKLEGKMSSDDKKQLVLYQLAASRALGLEVDALTFHYLEDGSKVQFLGTEKELAKFEDDVAQTVERISAQDFKETPGMHCSFCDFNNICEHAQR